MIVLFNDGVIKIKSSNAGIIFEHLKGGNSTFETSSIFALFVPYFIESRLISFTSRFCLMIEGLWFPYMIVVVFFCSLATLFSFFYYCRCTLSGTDILCCVLVYRF